MTSAPYTPPAGLVGKLKRRLTRLQARRALDCAQDRFLVSFSFDDFPKSAAHTGAAILERYGWRGTYYTSTGFENTDNHLGSLFSADDIGMLVGKGHEIGCHTENHIDCALNAPVVIEREVRRNQKRLRALGAPPLRSFAYPYGETSSQAKALLGQHYETLRGVKAGINRRFADAHQLSAVPIEGTEAQSDLALSYVENLKNSPGWLIFYTHDVRDTPGEWGCTPELFETICKAVKAAGFEVLPVGSAFAALTAMEKAA
jgi:peptidoglycan/xylan/chitin deacetylase (PgdA/CDA1 family)